MVLGKCVALPHCWEQANSLHNSQAWEGSWTIVGNLFDKCDTLVSDTRCFWSTESSPCSETHFKILFGSTEINFEFWGMVLQLYSLGPIACSVRTASQFILLCSYAVSWMISGRSKGRCGQWVELWTWQLFFIENHPTIWNDGWMILC